MYFLKFCNSLAIQKQFVLYVCYSDNIFHRWSRHTLYVCKRWRPITLRPNSRALSWAVSDYAWAYIFDKSPRFPGQFGTALKKEGQCCRIGRHVLPVSVNCTYSCENSRML